MTKRLLICGNIQRDGDYFVARFWIELGDGKHLRLEGFKRNDGHAFKNVWRLAERRIERYARLARFGLDVRVETHLVNCT